MLTTMFQHYSHPLWILFLSVGQLTLAALPAPAAEWTLENEFVNSPSVPTAKTCGFPMCATARIICGSAVLVPVRR